MLVYKWKPAPFGLAMLSGFFIFWLVSILTKPEDKEKIEAFFDNMRRKSDAKHPGEDGKKPLASETGDDLLLLDLPGWAHKDQMDKLFQPVPGRSCWILVKLDGCGSADTAGMGDSSDMISL